jgi:hypothetical protein
MILVTYQGEAETTWRGRAFVPGLAVAFDPVSDAAMIAKARLMPDFAVADGEVLADADDLRAQAESLGIKVDRRWGVERLQAEIDAALEA